MKKNRLSLAFLSLLIAASPLRAQDTLQNETVEQKDKRMEWFSQAKLGIFIHWGIYSVRGVSESWSFFNNYLPYDEYMEQEKGFTASKYDPKAWVDLIKESGAKYTVITTKHHDGVALWDTKVGDISVVKSTPAKRDLIAPFVKEVRKQGLKLGFYYSLLDWSHPDYPNKTRTEVRYKNDPERWARFNKFNFGQLAELNKTWKPDLYWFDGDWEQSAEAWNSKGIVDLLREDRCRDQIDHLLFFLYGFKGCPERNLRLSVAHISTDQAVHDFLALHVPLRIIDGGELVIRLIVGEHLLEFLLPHRIRSVLESLRVLSRRIELHELLRDLPDCRADLCLRLRPLGPAKLI